MSSGIYLLEFGNLYRYVGQAVDIDARVQKHIDSLLTGKAANKLMVAFHNYGLPKASVIAHCHRDHLDALEAYYINLYFDEFSLNTTKPLSTISCVDDALIETLQNPVESICEDMEQYKSLCFRYKAVVEDYEVAVEHLKAARSAEELEADISGTIYRLQGDKEDLHSDLEYYKTWINNAVNLPWYKKIFLKAP